VAALQVPGVVVRNNNSRIHLPQADGVTQLVDGRVIADQSKSSALTQRGNQFAALRRSAVIHRSELYVGHIRAERETQQ